MIKSHGAEQHAQSAALSVCGGVFVPVEALTVSGRRYRQLETVVTSDEGNWGDRKSRRHLFTADALSF